MLLSQVAAVHDPNQIDPNQLSALYEVKWSKISPQEDLYDQNFSDEKVSDVTMLGMGYRIDEAWACEQRMAKVEKGNFAVVQRVFGTLARTQYATSACAYKSRLTK